MHPAAAERRPGLPLGRPLGIPIFLAPSWIFAGLLITYSVAPVFSAPFSPQPRHYGLSALAAVLLAVSVLAHELGHSVVSLGLGIPIKRVTLFLFGGLAEMEREPDTPAGEYLVAVAGPLVSVFVAGVMAAGAMAAPGDSSVRRLAGYLAVTNAVLAILNLLPGLPLDGGRILRASVWQATGSRHTGTRVGVRGGQTVALLAAAFGLVRIGAGDQLGFFELLVAAFLWTNATAVGRRADVVARMERVDIRALVRPALPVAASLPLSEALRRAVDAGKRLVVVDSYGAPAGVISGHALAAVPEQRRPWVTVADVSRALEPGLVLEPGLDGAAVLERMRATPATEYLVAEPDGTVAGVLSAHDVARALDGRIDTERDREEAAP
ncbi:MAG TPA: site-2 protease family protein [Frankiaceae bacterium]|nr:site-2 protease family protein [Frankiaceae bacterium]